MRRHTGQFGMIDRAFLARSLGMLDPRTPICVSESGHMPDVLRILKTNRIGCVLVIAPNGKLSGVFTERDVLQKLVLEDYDYDESVVADVMTRNPETARMTTTIAFALNMMAHGGYRHLPIVDDDHMPVGIISVKDIVEYLAGAVLHDPAGYAEHRPHG